MNAHEQEAYEHESLSRSREEWDAEMEAICAASREPQERSTVEVEVMSKEELTAFIEALTAYRDALPEDSEPLPAWVNDLWEEESRSAEREALAALNYEDAPEWVEALIEDQLNTWEAERA